MGAMNNRLRERALEAKVRIQNILDRSKLKAASWKLFRLAHSTLQGKNKVARKALNRSIPLTTHTKSLGGNLTNAIGE
jgi:hypothetical protein